MKNYTATTFTWIANETKDIVYYNTVLTDLQIYSVLDYAAMTISVNLQKDSKNQNLISNVTLSKFKRLDVNNIHIGLGHIKLKGSDRLTVTLKSTSAGSINIQTFEKNIIPDFYYMYDSLIPGVVFRNCDAVNFDSQSVVYVDSEKMDLISGYLVDMYDLKDIQLVSGSGIVRYANKFSDGYLIDDKPKKNNEIEVRKQKVKSLIGV
jgi:hypothetical protein